MSGQTLVPSSKECRKVQIRPYDRFCGHEVIHY